MNNYFFIQNLADIHAFMEETNALHDGYIITMEYSNTGIKPTNSGYEFDCTLVQLKIQVMITSIKDVILEMVFENVLKWEVTKEDQYPAEIIASDICFDKHGNIIWSDDKIDLKNVEKNNIYVIAKKMKWRIL